MWNIERPASLMQRFVVAEALGGLAYALIVVLGHFEVTVRIAMLMILVATYGLGLFMGGTANRIFDRWATGRAIKMHMSRHYRAHPECPAAPEQDATVTTIHRGAA